MNINLRLKKFSFTKINSKGNTIFVCLRTNGLIKSLPNERNIIPNTEIDNVHRFVFGIA